MRKTLVLFAVLLILFACKKSEDTIAPTIENVAGSYKIHSLTSKTGGDPEQDITNLIPACEVDNIYTFKTDKTYIVTDAGTICSPSTDHIGTWSVTDQYFELDRNLNQLVKYDGKYLKYNSKQIGPNTLIFRTFIKQ